MMVLHGMSAPHGGRGREGKKERERRRGRWRKGEKEGDFGLKTGSPAHQEASLCTRKLKCDPTQPSATQQGLTVHTRAEV